ncbi:NUDIX hydrolase, partial [Vibrio lentus]|nr:NUDIX hydrolase [Vibrio lentus]
MVWLDSVITRTKTEIRSNDMHKVIDKLAWIFIKDGKLLMVRSKGKELFYLPGGK